MSRDWFLKYFFLSIFRIRQALEKLNDLVDESDPDISLPNIVHAFQGKHIIKQIKMNA